MLHTLVYPGNSVYPVYPCMFTLEILYTGCIPLYNYPELCTYVNPSHTVYLVHPCISCVPMFTLEIPYTQYNFVYPVYPCHSNNTKCFICMTIMPLQ